MKIALLLVIENSETNLGPGENWKSWDHTNPASEPLEEEAYQCVNAWRKNAGWLKDIDIHCICPSNKPPSSVYIKMLKELGVNYIHNHCVESDSYECGYLNIPLGLSMLENRYYDQYDYFIHIDLDMTIIKPLPKELFKDDMVVGILNDKKPFQYVPLEYNFESCFMITKTDIPSFCYWKGYIDTYKYQSRSMIPDKYIAEKEEFFLDYMQYIHEYITPIKDYQVGYRYPIDHLSDEELDGIYFHHNHLYESNENFEKYIKRRLK